MFSKVGAGLNFLFQPLPLPDSSPQSTATPTMYICLAPAMAIPVAVAGTVTTKLRNITVVPRRICRSALNEFHDIFSSTCKGQPKDGLVSKNGALTGFEDSLGNINKEVTYFLYSVHWITT